MFGTTGNGWLFSLSDDSDWGSSDWGSVDKFYRSIYGDMRNSELDEKGRFLVDHRVYGTRRSYEYEPVAGDGFAFYHSTRATFPKNDEFKRKARISLMGELVEMQFAADEPRKINRICVSVSQKALEQFPYYPIVRNDSTKNLFEDCGITKGPIATLYYAPKTVWEQFVEEVGFDIA